MTNLYGLKVKYNDIGYLPRLECDDLHTVKSVAGHLFHEKRVVAVCVFDALGTACLYLKKNDDGTVLREERESPLSDFFQ